MTKKIIIAGGGTGGHIFPAIAIAGALQGMGKYEFLFIGAKGKMEMEKIPQAGYNIKGLDMVGFNRKSIFQNLKLPFKLVKSFLQVRRIFKEFTPDAVIGVGGYSTFPVVKQAQQKGIPSFIFEVNAFAGKANLWLAKNATQIFTASDGMEKFFPKEKITVTGNPIRADIVSSKVQRQEAISYFGFKNNWPTVLVFGGSLGAKSINDAILAGLPLFQANQLQLIWQTGKLVNEGLLTAARKFENIWVGEFINDMAMAYAAADAIICRAGGSVYELCVIGKPAILVPYPFATDDHQTQNANRLVAKDAAICIKDSEVATKLLEALLGLMQNKEQQKNLSKNISALAITDAAERIAAAIHKYVNPKAN